MAIAQMPSESMYSRRARASKAAFGTSSMLRGAAGKGSFQPATAVKPTGTIGVYSPTCQTSHWFSGLRTSRGACSRNFRGSRLVHTSPGSVMCVSTSITQSSVPCAIGVLPRVGARVGESEDSGRLPLASAAVELRDHVPSDQLDRPHHLRVRQLVRVHQAEEQVAARRLVALRERDAAVRVPNHRGARVADVVEGELVERAARLRLLHLAGVVVGAEVLAEGLRVVGEVGDDLGAALRVPDHRLL